MPLHVPVLSNELSKFSSLADANTGAVLPGSGSARCDRLPSFLHGARGLHVIRPCRTPSPPPSFRVSPTPETQCDFERRNTERGWLFAEIKRGPSPELAEVDAPAFQPEMPHSVIINITWPGYTRVTRPRRLKMTEGGGQKVTKWSLAQEIAKYLEWYLEEAKRCTPDMMENPLWTVPPGSRVDDFLLLSVNNWGNPSVFQVEVAYIRR
ncbi:uncharacterized protein BXZ73DRAFT_99485 [Epithele typhae]|uniref:uncharacterized protein n=1 Tax=Epithele typhae TaxID=378194 RepID=UPI0020080E45|nr:uncharacterized protein BXZ73DRAFT_99485 [Epithele typhae]KAH9939281.1 hypothetical protein BXZ73DRAFT_99485 [Epithele typhae]